MVITSIVRIPAIIVGMAKGISIFHKRCILVSPNAIPASHMASSIWLRPVNVFRTIGNKAYITNAIIAVVLPTPDTYNKRPNIDIDGIVYRKLTTTITGTASRLYSYINTPNNPPMMVAITEANTEISICSHNNWRKKS